MHSIDMVSYLIVKSLCPHPLNEPERIMCRYTEGEDSEPEAFLWLRQSLLAPMKLDLAPRK